MSNLLHSTPSIFCVGRNYAEHARELGNSVPTEFPVLFSKPFSSVLDASSKNLNAEISVPESLGRVDHEVELVVRMGPHDANGKPTVGAIAIGIDLTARDLQAELKKQGLPWERAKGRKGFAVIGRWLEMGVNVDFALIDLDHLAFELSVNGQIRQVGRTSDMIFSVSRLLELIQQEFGAEPGDWVYTGTPAGVAPLKKGDQVYARLVSPKLPNTFLSELWVTVI